MSGYALTVRLDTISNWAKMWELRFSCDKCQLLKVGYSNPRVAYHLGNHVITPRDAVCDLGMNIHSSLKPSFHISTIVRIAIICSKLILKYFLSCKPNNIIHVFEVYVRTLLYEIPGFHKILI